MGSAAVVQDKVNEKAKMRPIFRFDVPEGLAKTTGIKKLGLHQLTASEELMATKRARNDTHRLAYELAKQALVEIDGKPITLGDGSADTAWGDMHPKIRTLAVAAFGELHSPEEDEIAGFLKSQTVHVG